MIAPETWRSQCDTARGILDAFGAEKALSYLIGDKFLRFLEVAESDPEWRAEIPAFVTEIKAIFKPWQLVEYLATSHPREASGRVAAEESHQALHSGIDEEETVGGDVRNLPLLAWARTLLLEESSDPLWPRRAGAIAQTFSEAGLLLLALAIGWLFGRWPLATVAFTAEAWPANLLAVGWGCLAALPLVLFFFTASRYEVVWSRESLRVWQEQFSEVSSSAIVGLCIIASVGEEMLFRGLLQAGLSDWIEPPFGLAIGLSVASLVEGIIQDTNWRFFAYSTIVAFCLGWLFFATDNLLAPIVTRFTYNCFFLMYVCKWKKGSIRRDVKGAVA